MVNTGNKDFDSEELAAYEFGYRIRQTEKLSADFTAFYNVYDQLRTIEFGTPTF